MANKLKTGEEMLTLPIPTELKTALKAEAALVGKTLAELVTEKLGASLRLQSVDGHYTLAATPVLCEQCRARLESNQPEQPQGRLIAKSTSESNPLKNLQTVSRRMK